MISIYLVSVTIMQKNGAGLINACSCYWDTICDGNKKKYWRQHIIIYLFVRECCSSMAEGKI